jgi:hypothetical protein
MARQRRGPDRKSLSSLTRSPSRLGGVREWPSTAGSVRKAVKLERLGVLKMVNPERLRIATLKYLRVRNGEQLGLNAGNWAIRLATEQGLGYVGPEEVEAEIKCLCAEGIVQLSKWDDRLGGLYQYHSTDGAIIERQFFGFGCFDVRITDGGRWYLNVPTRSIGFQPQE